MPDNLEKSVRLMKTNFTPSGLLIAASFCLALHSSAQCPGGYTASQLNWDNLDFLPSNNTRYTDFYPNAAFPYNQNFTMGTRTVNFVMAPANTLALGGENGTNTAHAAPVTAGDDVQFTTSGTGDNTITITFDADVANLRFSLFDIDNGQRATVTAVNGAATAQNITATLPNGGSGITIAGSGTATASATGPGGYGSTDTRGTVNFSINGPVRRVTITLNTAAGDVWLSDLDACVTGTFPTGYQAVSRPFTGQPQYVLTVVNNNIYYVDPTNGQAYFLFNEPAHNRLNSMAYDPYERIVYYTYSLGPDPENDRTLKKYDVDTKTISVVIPNVNSFGIPTYESGVESGAASFYNGSLYLGIEGYTGENYAASRKSTIWKINFDASGNPIAPAAQVYGVLADDGNDAQNIHDWSDFGISNGNLVDFDGSQSGDYDYFHFNLMSGAVTNYIPVGPIPRQVSLGWDELYYNVDATIGRYNGTNGIVGGSTFTITSPLGPTIPTGGSWGDAAGPYRPFLDFGDAPASYDPDPLSPACHDTLTPTVLSRRTRMILGPGEDVEWLKRGFTTTEDNFEDGLSFVPIFTTATGTYQCQVTCMNNTGAAARICAWLDFNGNGYFDAAEGITPVNVPSAAGVQTYWLVWPSITSTLPVSTYTYLRIRITTASYGMTQANSTGYYNRGEVEDYRVFVDDFPLTVSLISFDATVTDESDVKLRWSTNEENGLAMYDIQRSSNGADWEDIAYIQGSEGAGEKNYQYIDNDPYKGISFYRIKMSNASGQFRYSIIKSVTITDLSESIRVFPNPTQGRATLAIRGDIDGETANVTIIDARGVPVYYKKLILTAGANSMEIPVQDSWPSGMYIVQVSTDRKVLTKNLVLRRQ
jgi:hypothetical protein